MSRPDPNNEYGRRRSSRKVRGIRTFLIQYPDLELVGWWGGTWRPGVNMATCRESPLKGVPGGEDMVPPGFHLTPTKFGTDHEIAGDVGCQCGAYLYHKLPDPEEDFSFAQQAVIGDLLAVCEGWGSVLVGDRGARVQKAQILALAPNWGSSRLPPLHELVPILEHLSDRYQVPMLEGRDELLAAFPLATAFGIPSAA